MTRNVLQLLRLLRLWFALDGRVVSTEEEPDPREKNDFSLRTVETVAEDEAVKLLSRLQL